MRWREVDLPSGHVLLFDVEDWSIVRQHKWHAFPGRQTFYAQAADGQTLLHRLLLNADADKQVDHANGNGLDNRRFNLRSCTVSQNLANRGAPVNNTSGFKGVSWNKRLRKFQAYITVNKQRQHLGFFTDPEKAAQAYNDAALKAWGEFALLNS